MFGLMPGAMTLGGSLGPHASSGRRWVVDVPVVAEGRLLWRSAAMEMDDDNLPNNLAVFSLQGVLSSSS